MNKNPISACRNLIIYQIYVRNHSIQGTFIALERDLPRIRNMGVDVVYLMPIHPIGKLNKKGSLGCPYSIADYRGINPEYGSLQDFQHFLDTAHKLGLKVMIDVVFNHTAHDSVLVREHPDWFHQDDAGNPYTTVPEWSDVIDLKFPNAQMEDYLIDTLVYWVKMGVDGFRCDVASLIPLKFWKAARRAVENVNPGVIWLAESVHTGFILDRRAHDLLALSDGELFEVFDICYDYDIWPVFQKAVSGDIPVASYLDMLRFQESIYPASACKLRFVENHDQRRFMDYVKKPECALAWTALQAFNKGSFMIYAGQESGETKRTSLFDIDRIDCGNYEYQAFLTSLTKLKKHSAMVDGQLSFTTGVPAVVGYWVYGEQSLLGVFNVTGEKNTVSVKAPDCEYRDLLDGRAIEISNGLLVNPAAVTIIECNLHDMPSIDYRSWIQ